jgi:hypothetical protein
LNTIIPAIPQSPDETYANNPEYRRVPKFELFGQIVVKIFLVGLGLAMGSFLGFIIALFTGLIDFSC